METKLTLLELAKSNKSFQKWTREYTSTHDLSHMDQLLFAGDQFRKLLIKGEEEKMDEFLMDGGPAPDWVKVCQQAQTPTDKIIETTQKTIYNIKNMETKLTLLELATSNPSFQKWTREYTSTHDLSRMHQLLFAGDQFRELLIKSEEEKMDKFLMDGGPAPDWVKICQQAQTPNDKIIETTQKTIAALGGMTVMCFECGSEQPMGTKCYKSDAYHM